MSDGDGAVTDTREELPIHGTAGVREFCGESNLRFSKEVIGSEITQNHL